MSKLLNAAVLALTVSATLGAIPAADAAETSDRVWGGLKNTEFKALASSSGFDTVPTLVFVPNKDGKYEFDELDTPRVHVRLRAQKVMLAWISSYKVRLGHYKGRIAAGSGFGEVNIKKLDKTFSFNVKRDDLKVVETKGRQYCQQNGKSNEKVIENSAFNLYARIDSKGKNKYGSLTQTINFESIIKYPMKVVCMPQPFQVKSLNLSVNYHGSPKSCPVDVTLKGDFKTNKPGEKNKITFMLVRDDGARQTITIEASGSLGNAYFRKKYKFHKPVDRKYLITVQGSPISTQWVPMKVTCGSGPGSFSSGPVSTQ